MAIVSDNIIGAACMSAAMAGLILNDAIIKIAADDLGLFQAIFVRGVFATLLIGLFAWHRGAFTLLPKARDRKIIALRVTCELAATLLFLSALFKMPIANVTAILQSLPLAVTLAAAIYLKEPFGLKRGLAILSGFIGVLIIVRPGTEGFNIYSLYAVCAVGVITIRELITRQLSRNANSLFIAVITALVITIAGGIGTALLEVWHPLDLRTLALLALAAVFLLVGYYFSIAAMRVGEIAIVSPFRYTMMLWAITLGYFIFGDIPDNWTLLGMLIVVGTGVFAFYREHKLASKNA